MIKCIVKCIYLLKQLLSLDSGQGILNVPHSAWCRLEELGASLLKDVEPEYLGFVVKDLWWQYDRFWIMLEEYMWETRSEVSSINIDAPKLGQIDFLTSGAEDLEPGCFKLVTQSNWKSFLFITKSSRTVTIYAWEELLINLSDASRGMNISSMDQPVHVRCLLVQFQEMLIT